MKYFILFFTFLFLELNSATLWAQGPAFQLFEARKFDELIDLVIKDEGARYEIRTTDDRIESLMEAAIARNEERDRELVEILRYLMDEQDWLHLDEETATSIPLLRTPNLEPPSRGHWGGEVSSVSTTRPSELKTEKKPETLKRKASDLNLSPFERLQKRSRTENINPATAPAARSRRPLTVMELTGTDQFPELLRNAAHLTRLTIIVPFQENNPNPVFLGQSLQILGAYADHFINLRSLYLQEQEPSASHRLFADLRVAFPLIAPAPALMRPQWFFDPWDLVYLQSLPNLRSLDIEFSSFFAPSDPDLFWGIQWRVFRNLRELRVRGLEATRRHDGYFRGPRFRDIQHLDRFVWDASQWTIADFGSFFEFADDSSQLFSRPMTIEFHSLQLTDGQLARIRRLVKEYLPKLDLLLVPRH